MPENPYRSPEPIADEQSDSAGRGDPIIYGLASWPLMAAVCAAIYFLLVLLLGAPPVRE